MDGRKKIKLFVRVEVIPPPLVLRTVCLMFDSLILALKKASVLIRTNFNPRIASNATFAQNRVVAMEKSLALHWVVNRVRDSLQICHSELMQLVLPLDATQSKATWRGLCANSKPIMICNIGSKHGRAKITILPPANSADWSADSDEIVVFVSLFWHLRATKRDWAYQFPHLWPVWHQMWNGYIMRARFHFQSGEQSESAWSRWEINSWIAFRAFSLDEERSLHFLLFDFNCVITPPSRDHRTIHFRLIELSILTCVYVRL